MPDDGTQIPVKKSTRARLRETGSKGETYDDIINRVLDKFEEKTGDEEK